jgi:hypothetical protein
MANKIKIQQQLATNSHYIHNEIKNKLFWPCYHLDQSLLSSCTLSKNQPMKMMKTTSFILFSLCGKTSTYKILVRILQRKRPNGRSRLRWQDIKMIYKTMAFLKNSQHKQYVLYLSSMSK